MTVKLSSCFSVKLFTFSYIAGMTGRWTDLGGTRNFSEVWVGLWVDFGCLPR